jgi:threonine dehydrogenase-like Zn-dependent dehydrogenase
MKAVICQNAELWVEDIPDPVPGPGQVLVAVERCGICGSDLHLRHHCDHMKALLGRVGAGAIVPASSDRVVFGHEFCCEVLDYGRDCERKVKTGTRVVAQPAVRVGKEIHLAGLSPVATGGYAERMVLQESALVPVPNGLGADLAALTEPMAVGLHAVRRSEISRKDVAIVIGCGPVGLAVICILKSQGIATIVASDLSAGRRALARRCGAECVGVPGIVQQIVDGAPLMARIVVAGVCMQVDHYEPALAIHKEVDLRFVFGHSPLEFRDTVHLIAQGKVDCTPLVTGIVGLEGVASAFDALADPERHAKILVDPRCGVSSPVPVSFQSSTRGTTPTS